MTRRRGVKKFNPSAALASIEKFYAGIKILAYEVVLQHTKFSKSKKIRIFCFVFSNQKSDQYILLAIQKDPLW